MKGWPDYTRVTGLVDNYDEFAQNYPVGIGDGAARLGSIKTYDMRGRVWWMDDFEAATLHWGTSSSGTGGTQRLSSDYARTGEQSLRLQANTGAIRQSAAAHRLPLPRERKIGIEQHISNEAGFDTLEARINVDLNGDRVSPWLKLYEPDLVLFYLDHNNIYQPTGIDTGLTNDLDHFHSMKAVIDYKTNTWVRIMWDAQEIDMTGIPLRHTALGGRSSMYIQYDNIGDNIGNSNIYIDDVILTIMEPD